MTNVNEEQMDLEVVDGTDISVQSDAELVAVVQDEPTDPEVKTEAF